jgi:uncharacterized Zn-binding protein involved in type VI secretion
MPSAARIGDNCTGHGCFPASSIIAGSGDTFINGIPAARVNDAVLLHVCPCPKMPHGMHGRKIAKGSSNVSINGQAAARVGDKMACGGAVSAGSGDVLIGDTPYSSAVQKCAENASHSKNSALTINPIASAVGTVWADPHFMQGLLGPVSTVERRKKRYQQRQQLATAMADQPGMAEASKRLAFNNDNILRAEAAQYMYKVDEFNRGHITELPPPPLGLTILEPSAIKGMEDAVLTDTKSGFGAALFESEINGETMLTFKGTTKFEIVGKLDWYTNLKQTRGKQTAQYDQAMDLALLTSQTLGLKVVSVGHSLGAGLAASAVGVTGMKGYTYNAAGLHPNTVAREQGLRMPEINALIQTQAVKYEFLTMAQNPRVKDSLLTVLGGLPGGLLGAAIGSAVSKSTNVVPQAPGTMHKLPSIEGGTPFDRHAMVQVITGIEAQKKQDIITLTKRAK